MEKVTDDLLFSDLDRAGDPNLHERHGVTDVVQLSYESAFAADSDSPPDRATVHEFSVMDGPKNDADTMERAVETVVDLVRREQSVLVHCAGGASRSPSVVAAALSVADGVDFDEALASVRDTGDVAVHPAVQENARRVARRLG